MRHVPPSDSPPTGNTGAENTSLASLIDWCAFTLKDSDSLEKVLSVIGIPYQDFIEMPKGGLGYKRQLRNGNIAIFEDGAEGMGIHIEMSGKGCREFDSFTGNWRGLFRRVHALSGHFSRLDVAIDDRLGMFSLEEVQEKMKRREVRSRFKKGRSTESYEFSDTPGKDGKTLYFGSGKSDIQIRIYDKAAEQGLDGVWLRTELECRNVRADILAQHLSVSDELGAIAAGVLKNYLAFIEPGTDSNKSRWAVSSWWSDFLGAVERVKLSIRKIERTIDQVKEWTKKQVAPSLALLFKFFEGDFQFFDELISDGERRLKPRHLAMLPCTG